MTDDPNLWAYVAAMCGGLCLLMALWPRPRRW